MPGHRWISLFLIALTIPTSGCLVDGGKASLWNPFVRADKSNEADSEPLPKFVRRLSDSDEKTEPEKPKAPIAESRVESLLADGQRALQENRIADAQRYYNEVIQFLPDNATAHHGLAMAADLTENWKDAESHYRQALRSRPQDANLLCDIGYSYLLQNRYSEASSYLSQAIQINPNHENAHTNLAMLDLRQGNRESARQRIVARFGNTAKATQILAALETQVGAKAGTALSSSAPEVSPNASFEEVREIARRERIAAEQRRNQQMMQTGLSTEEPLANTQGGSNHVYAANAGPGSVNPAIHQTIPPGSQFPGGNATPPWNAPAGNASVMNASGASLPVANATPPSRFTSDGRPVDQSGTPVSTGAGFGQSNFQPSAMNSEMNHGYPKTADTAGVYVGNVMNSSVGLDPSLANSTFAVNAPPANPAYNAPSGPNVNTQGPGGVIPVRPSGAFQLPMQGVSYGQPVGFGQPSVETAGYQNPNSGQSTGNANYGATASANQANWNNAANPGAQQNLSNLPLAGLNAGPGALFPIGQYPNSAGGNANAAPGGSTNQANPNAFGQYLNGQPPMSGLQLGSAVPTGQVNMGNVSAPGTNSMINGAMYGQPVSSLPSQEWMMQQQQQIQQLQQQQGNPNHGYTYPGTNGSNQQTAQFGNTNGTTAPRPGTQAPQVNPLATYENQLRELDNQYNSTLQQMDRNATANIPRAQY